MHSDIFERHAQKRKIEDEAIETDAETFDDLGSFGWLRGVRDKAPTLEIRHKDGRITAHSYAWLESAVFDPSDGVTLNFSGKTVTIIGRNLNTEVRPNVRMFAGILRHRVPWILEADGPTIMQAAKHAVVIEEVKLE